MQGAAKALETGSLVGSAVISAVGSGVGVGVDSAGLLPQAASDAARAQVSISALSFFFVMVLSPFGALYCLFLSTGFSIPAQDDKAACFLVRIR